MAILRLVEHKWLMWSQSYGLAYTLHNVDKKTQKACPHLN